MASRARGAVRFPHPSRASPEGIVAVGGAPDPDVLRTAYTSGIFPWPHEGFPLLWFSPDPRFVLEPAKAHVPKSLRKAMKRGVVDVRADTAFPRVMEACAAARRRGQRGTWITDEMIAGYTALHGEGVAHSIEAWRGDELVGGLYGVSFGAVFFGESMFATQPEASKIAFATLLANLIAWRFPLVDCQSYTEHLARFGAVHWPRAVFLDALATAQRAPTKQGPWRLDVSAVEAAAVLPSNPLPDDDDGGG
jgi:leucyl/phenylalanyl-tRNA---protein transferase